MLLDIDRSISDRSNKSAIDILPMKDLAGVQCYCEIKIECANLGQFHIQHSPKNDEARMTNDE